MKRTWLKWTNGILFFVAFIQAFTGIWMLISLIAFKKDAPEAVITIHMWNGVILVIAVIIHVGLNWVWIRNNFLKKRSVV